MTEPLSIAFVWHMHQPYYRGSSTGRFEMPWVRLHALKDYADMVTILEDFPAIHQTFNLVPSLLEQLEQYAAGDFQDRYWEHTLVPAEELDEAQRDFIVDLMVERSSHPRTQRSPRYLELARKKEAGIGEGLSACAARFSPQELRDLQVWFTLAWFDPRYLEQEPLAALVAKDRDFSEEDKAVLAAEQARILADTLPAYRRAVERGQVELTTTPYYHPILPLLIDSDLARVARGDIPLPSRRYAHPEDAREQLERGLEEFGRVFGGPPRGLWCSEMAVGEVVIPLLAQAGIEWTLSDEGTLGRSLRRDIARNEAGHVLDPDVLYSAYRLEREGSELSIAFRDRVLSDLIGFTYQTWAPHDAAANLVWRLREIRRNLDGSAEPHLVTIALDGENAWEYYQRDGHDFLTALYDTLSNDPGFACVTVSEFLDRHPATRPLPWLHTGSWIYADLSTWMGDPAHTRAWDLLHDARDHVAAARAAATPPPTLLPTRRAVRRRGPRGGRRRTGGRRHGRRGDNGPRRADFGHRRADFGLRRRPGGGLAAHPRRPGQRLVLVVQRAPGERHRPPLGPGVPPPPAGGLPPDRRRAPGGAAHPHPHPGPSGGDRRPHGALHPGHRRRTGRRRVGRGRGAARPGRRSHADGRRPLRGRGALRHRRAPPVRAGGARQPPAGARPGAGRLPERPRGLGRMGSGSRPPRPPSASRGNHRRRCNRASGWPTRPWCGWPDRGRSRPPWPTRSRAGGTGRSDCRTWPWARCWSWPSR